MGWWSEEEGGEELVIGDEPMDAVGLMLSSLGATYTKEVGRKPTAKELARLLEAVLASIADETLELGDNELAGVCIRLKKKPKRRRLVPGDYFAVPLSDGGYGYGRIKDICLRSVLLVDFLKLRSRNLLKIHEAVLYPALMEVICGSTSLESAEWRVIGNVPLEVPLSELPDRDRLKHYNAQHRKSYGALAAQKFLEEKLIGCGIELLD